MSNSGPRRVGPPGGAICRIIDIVDREGRSISEYSWSAATARPVLEVCLAHDPADDSRCELLGCSPPSPLLKQIEYWDRTSRRCSASGSHDSDATVEIFERPCADPQTSPVQLPPLCDGADSDDELFMADNALTKPPLLPNVTSREESSDFYVLLRTISWVTELRSDPPTDVELPQVQFTFAPPSTAPQYPSPLHVEYSKEIPVPPLKSLALVASLALHEPLFHPRPSDDPEHLESDLSLVSRLQCPDSEARASSAVHPILLEHSTGGPDSYKTASHVVQRSVLRLIQTVPWLRVDTVTPLERFPCHFPDCDEVIPCTRDDVGDHLRHAHWPAKGKRRKARCCPMCSSSLLPCSLNRYLLDLHPQTDADVVFVCKLCGDRYSKVAKYRRHFFECQRLRFWEENTRPAKRRRIGQ